MTFTNFTRAQTMVVRPPLWLACARPEQPPDPYVVWHYEGCEPCRLKASVQRVRFPDDSHVEWLCRTMGLLADTPPT